MKLKQLRKASNLTQEQLASYLGIDQTTLAKIENGTRRLNTTLEDKFQKLFGCGAIQFPKGATKEEIEAIAMVNKIAINIKFMNEVEE